jgi:flagellin
VALQGNTSGVNATYFLNIAGFNLNKSITRLGSGSRIVDPGDDAAGVAVSGKMNSQTRRLGAISDGALTLISFAQTALGSLNNIQNELDRMNELALRATNGAFSQSDRLDYAIEFNQLASAITVQVSNATFNGAALFQTGATGATASTTITAEGLQFALILADLRDQTGTGALSGLGALAISTTVGASGAIASLTTHIENIAAATANYASAVSLLNFHIDNAQTHNVNLTSANSRFKDLNYAAESVQLAKFSILNQSATSMIAQANVSSTSVLSLLM